MKRFGLIGKPLIHAASALYFAEKFSREGIVDCRYDLYELDAICDLNRLLNDTPELCGFNVTIPFKQQILPLLDALAPEAERIGAVNCVKREGDRWIGFNTDIVGIRATLADLLSGDLPERALVLGTGGASQAVQYVLTEMDIPFSTVSRDPAKGNYSYERLSCDVVTSSRLLINASPVGTFPLTDEAPRIDYACITPRHYLFDLVYNPAHTRFLEFGSRQGARIRNGQTMFVRQAEASWSIWNGLT